MKVLMLVVLMMLVSVVEAKMMCCCDGCAVVLRENHIDKMEVGTLEQGVMWTSFGKQVYHYCPKCMQNLIDVLKKYDIEASTYTKSLQFEIHFPDFNN